MTPNTQSVCKYCQQPKGDLVHSRWAAPELHHKFEPVAGPASTEEQPTSLHCGCPDENHLPSCPTIFGAARPSEPSAPAHEVNSLSVQKRKHVMQGGKMSDFKAQPVAPDSHLGAVRD